MSSPRATDRAMGALSTPKIYSYSRSQSDSRPLGDAPTWPELMMPLQQLLTTGSDTRLIIDPATQLNVYGCAAAPRPSVISFASTTASTISANGYAAVQSARARLVPASLRGNELEAFDNALAELRAALKRAFTIDDPEIEVVLAPSGTDAQMQALFVARASLGAPLTSIVVAAEETGSGTAYTTLGQHFNSQAALGAHVVKGTAVDGLADRVTRIDVPVRNDNGEARSADEVDANVIAAIDSAQSKGNNVVLFAMDQSKSGLGGPSTDCLRHIHQQYGERVLIVLDACQGRLAPEEIKQHLSDGHVVLITGSKFFTGPPFSGVMFVPAALSDRMKRVRDVPAGLRDYCGRSEWPSNWANIRTQLPAQPNFGLWLRWEAALAEIEAYNAVPQSFRTLALRRFADALPSLIKEFEFLQLIDPAREVGAASSAQTDAIRTIYPFLVVKGVRPLSFDEARSIYEALNRDLSEELPGSASSADRDIASTLCHIGQPFLLKQRDGGALGALRVSADARFVSEAWDAGDEHASIKRVDLKIDQVRTVFKKMALILSRHSKFKD